MFDAHANFAYSNVAAPAPGVAGTDLVVAPGQGALFPSAPFNCTVWPSGVLPLASNAEIIRVTAVVGDTLTIVRAQEGTSSIDIQVGFQIANTTSVKVFTDIEDACVISAGTSAATGPFTFADGNGVTFGMDNGTVTASVATAAAASINFSAGTTSNNLNSITFANSNGVTFGLDNGTMTASVNTVGGSINFSAGTTSNNLASITFANGNGITFGLDNGTITASHNGITSQSNQAVSASNGSFAFQTLNFSNANGVTFGTSAGDIITASVNAAAGGSINFSAGTTSNNLASVTFANSNGVTFGLDNGTITASVNTAGGGNANTMSLFQIPCAPGNNTSLQTIAGEVSNVVLDPFSSPAHISFKSVQMWGSLTCGFNLGTPTTLSTASFEVGIGIAFYSRSVTDSGATNFSNSSVIASYISQSWTLTLGLSCSSSSKTVNIAWQTDSTGGSSSSSVSSNSSNIALPGFTGRMLFGIPFSGVVTPGDNWIGTVFRTTNSAIGNTSNGLVFGLYRLTVVGNVTQRSSLGDTGAGNVNGNNLVVPGLGYYSAQSTTPPTTVDLVNDVSNSPSVGQLFRYYVLKP